MARRMGASLPETDDVYERHCNSACMKGVGVSDAARSKDLIGREARFVLAASGHVAGVINPPARNKRSHWLNDDLGSNPQSWFDAAGEKPGSWWPDWDRWMRRHSGGTIPAPDRQGNARFSPLEPAPGRYVKEKTN